MTDAAARRVPRKMVDIDNRGIAALYERKLVLVRPDGHVAWREDVCPDDAFALIDRLRGHIEPNAELLNSGRLLWRNQNQQKVALSAEIPFDPI
jgi:hypothetical protein